MYRRTSETDIICESNDHLLGRDLMDNISISLYTMTLLTRITTTLFLFDPPGPGQ